MVIHPPINAEVSMLHDFFRSAWVNVQLQKSPRLFCFGVCWETKSPVWQWRGEEKHVETGPEGEGGGVCKGGEASCPIQSDNTITPRHFFSRAKFDQP